MLVFGGAGVGSLDDNPPHYNDLWELTLSGSPAWNELTPSGSLPGGRTDHEAIYDPARDRMILFEGAILPYFYGTYDDLWAIQLNGPLAWSRLAPTRPPGYRFGRGGSMALYDPRRDRMVVFGGYDTWAGERDDTLELLWGTPVSVGDDQQVPRGLFLHPPYPNPFASHVTFGFTLAQPVHAQVTVHDIRGRLIRTLLPGTDLPAGTFRYVWKGTDDRGQRVCSGLYVCNLKVGEQTYQRRVVLLR
jgi:hypothetical protein